MIGLYDDDGNRIAHAYNGLTINDDNYPVASAVVDHRYDSVTEPMAETDGMEAYAARRLSTLLRVDGTVEGTSVADLHDKIEALNSAFDPVRVTEDDTAAIYDAGFLPYAFSVPTEDTANYPSGLIPMQYYARSVSLPVPRISKFEGNVAKYTLILQAVDPRRYLQTESTASRINAGSFTVDNSLATYGSYPIITITLAAVGGGETAGTLSIRRDAGVLPQLTFVLDWARSGASVANDDVIVVDMRRRTVTKNGVTFMAPIPIYGNFWKLGPESHTISVIEAGNTFNGIVSVAWRRAFT